MLKKIFFMRIVEKNLQVIKLYPIFGISKYNYNDNN